MQPDRRNAPDGDDAGSGHQPLPVRRDRNVLGPLIDDRSVLDRLLHLAGPVDGAELMRRLDSDLEAAAQQLCQGLAGKDGAATRAATHVLTALAGTVGATRLSDLARKLNLAIHEGSTISGIDAAGQDILDMVADLRADLARWPMKAQSSGSGHAGKAERA